MHRCDKALLPIVLVFAACAASTVLRPRAAGAQESRITAAELALVKETENARIAAIEKVYGAVVAVYGTDQSEGGGSGVLYDPAGYALTNYHVVAGAGDHGLAGLADGKLYPWKLIGVDPGGDLAVIRLSGKEVFPTAPLGDSSAVRVGDWAIAMGNPFLLAEDQQPTVTLGVVSGVERYQPGVGENELVYGNCIQVDSSINPGNSGGPLFNSKSEVIGINGRASFQDRGRVNVGLGYAISINQVKRFLPELLATKTAQHGTLDAIFGQRGGKVICHTLNLDSPAALAGLALGDEMLEFEGETIRDANQLTNLISTLPAHWPVRFTVLHGVQRRTIEVRLLPLPYSPSKAPEAVPPEGGLPEAPQVIEIEGGPKPADPGEIGDMALNRQVARLLLDRTRRSLRTGDEQVLAWRWRDRVYVEGKHVGAQHVVLARDGRFSIDFSEGDEKLRLGFNGEQFWQQAGDQPAQMLKEQEAWQAPLLVQAALLTTFLADATGETDEKTILEGADKTQARSAYRLARISPNGLRSFLWLSSNDGAAPGEAAQNLPLKFALDRDSVRPAVLLRDWRTVAGMPIPWERAIVRGLAERPLLQCKTTACETLSEVEDAWFHPTNE